MSGFGSPSPPPPSNLPRVLLFGPRRSGKSSISQVVFNKMSPHETLFRLEGTSALDIMTVDNNALAQFEIYDFPGSYMSSCPPERDSEIFCNSDPASGVVVIFVLDAQDEPYDVVLTSLVQILKRGTRVNPSLQAHVFINKVDGELFLSEEAKYDCRRDVVSLVQEEMAEYDMEDVEVTYFLTSIYDHSVFEAFSKVTQKLVPTLPTIESLCNVLVGRCNMEKVFLFDVVSKLYISTDSSPVDAVSYELCSDMIDVVMDVSGIYGAKEGEEGGKGGGREGEGEGGEGADGADGWNMGGEDPSSPSPPPSTSYYDSSSSSCIHLSNGIVLYLKEVSPMLALVCLTREEEFVKRGLLDWNLGVFKKGMERIIKVIQDCKEEV